MKPSDHCLLCLHFHVMGNGSRVGYPQQFGWLNHWISKMYMDVYGCLKMMCSHQIAIPIYRENDALNHGIFGVYPIFRYHNHKVSHCSIKSLDTSIRWIFAKICIEIPPNCYHIYSSNSLSKSIDTSKSSSISTVHISPKVYQFLSRSSNIYQILWTSPTFYQENQHLWISANV